MKLGAGLRILSIIALASSLGGCLQPVHGVRIGNSNVSTELSRIAVAPIDGGYLGYTLKSELEFLLGNGAVARNPDYILTVKTAQSSSSSIIDISASRTQSVSVQAEAVYELRDQKTGTIRASGKTFGVANYDRSTQRFATLRAQRDAEERLGKALAERLRILLSAALVSDPKRDVGPAPKLNPPIDPFAEPDNVEPGNQT